MIDELIPYIPPEPIKDLLEVAQDGLHDPLFEVFECAERYQTLSKAAKVLIVEAFSRGLQGGDG
ncbi:MAG: hypothetical protein HC933_03790 [Pleurocapsa sp. SU_196_0]|nr:hypothetical protein [Pleurocapsa sp. SU_196_0]